MQLQSLAPRMRRYATPALFLGFTLAAAASASAQLSPSVQQQMSEIYAIKQSFTPAEQKMSFNLVLVSRAVNNQLPSDLTQLVDLSSVDANGNATIEVSGFMNSGLISAVASNGNVDDQSAQNAYQTGVLHATLNIQQLVALAARPDVKYVGDPDIAIANAGSVTTQGYISHSANKVIAGGVTGKGVIVGVLSDSALPAAVASLVASGDLPADVTVVPGQAGPTTGANEGAAMMEIVHDMAPDAKIVFATAYSTQAQFAANILTLRNTYHCDIIVDDISYFAEGAFQDGPVAQAVNTVTANGALYFSAAANSGNLTSGTSGTWEGDYLAGPAVSGPPTASPYFETGNVHNFGTAAAPVYYDTVKAASTYISLKWSDPLGASTNDYDLFVLNPAGTAIVKASGTSQTGTQDPFEAVSGTFPVGDRIVVVNYGTGTGDAARRALRVDTNRGQLTIATTGSTYGHNAAANTFTLAATYWNSAHTGIRAFVGGASNPIETFSSDGPRKIFYNPDGSAITPGNVLFATAGGTTLQKPEATAADGNVSATTGFIPFFGTSAAAPHAAGIAALVKSANLTLTNTQIRNILTSTAVDNMAPGVDRDGGYGVLQAVPAVAAAKAAVNTSLK